QVEVGGRLAAVALDAALLEDRPGSRGEYLVGDLRLRRGGGLGGDARERQTEDEDGALHDRSPGGRSALSLPSSAGSVYTEATSQKEGRVAAQHRRPLVGRQVRQIADDAL